MSQPPSSSSQDAKKSSASFTEMVQTPNATVKYTVHDQGHENMPDIEISACVEPHNGTGTDAKKDQKAQSSASTPHPELAEVAKMIEDHQRENEERKKKKEERKATKQAEGRAPSNESVQETVETQIKEIQDKKSKDAKPDDANK